MVRHTGIEGLLWRRGFSLGHGMMVMNLNLGAGVKGFF